jgi:hypothetical protein
MTWNEKKINVKSNNKIMLHIFELLNERDISRSQYINAFPNDY